MKTRESFDAVAATVAARLREQRVKLTVGGEPSYVPINPEGPEWSITALGPTKLGYAHALADALVKRVVPGAVTFFSPGKLYPGETNPRWAIHLVWKRDGTSMGLRRKPRAAARRPSVIVLRRTLLKQLKLRATWQRAADPTNSRAQVWVLPLDYAAGKWRSEKWLPGSGDKLALLHAEGPAGLRLPLSSLRPEGIKRALVLERKADGLHAFFPPLLQTAFLRLLRALARALNEAHVACCYYDGYIPADDRGIWSQLSLTPDPGVLEINLPACNGAREYARWMSHLEACTAAVGLRSFKQSLPEEVLGTGGGNHLLFGGPTLEENPFFKNPQWVTSILRYWQHHPSLSYLFTGAYVGAASQAPRADESAGELYNLEMAYQFLEQLKPDEDHRYLISETLRHLHIDRSGNTHRSEISFDKFWNAGFPGGCRGLIEFRALETLPHARWMSAVALLWTALAAFLLGKPYRRPLINHGALLHDAYFMPSRLWADFTLVLRDLRHSGFLLKEDVFREIWEFRFPLMLTYSRRGAQLTLRKALEGWPLLCETPLEGGTTSRYVDTSMERLEFTANRAFAAAYRVFLQGRELKLSEQGVLAGAALRYRRTALSPSLHPGIRPHTPLLLTITDLTGRTLDEFKLEGDRRQFEPTSDTVGILKSRPCRRLRPELQTCDLRLL